MEINVDPDQLASKSQLIRFFIDSRVYIQVQSDKGQYNVIKVRAFSCH